MKHLVLPVLLLTVGAVNAQLLSEDFEGYAVGDYISVVGQPAGAWNTWIDGNAGTTMDAQISDEAALSGANSLKIYGGIAGGPMDIMLLAGITGAYEVTFNILIPEGNSGYYNVQENIIPGTSWAFECNLNGNGSVNYNIDGGAYTLDASYTQGEWLKIAHLIDTDSDLMHVYFNDEYVGQLPFDGVEIGGVNFYAAGDGLTTPTYYIDDVFVDVTDEVVDGVEEEALALSFGPNPAQNSIFLQANVAQATVRILSLDGKVVSETLYTNLQAGTYIPLDLNSGLYFVELSNGNIRNTQRLVVQK